MKHFQRSYEGLTYRPFLMSCLYIVTVVTLPLNTLSIVDGSRGDVRRGRKISETGGTARVILDFLSL